MNFLVKWLIIPKFNTLIIEDSEVKEMTQYEKGRKTFSE
jgi:hypothetical protein